MIELDGDNFEWYADAYYRMEGKRNNTWPRPGPGEDEVEIITAAVKCPDAEFDPNVQSLFLSCLAQYFKEHGCPFSFGTEDFISDEQVIRFIKSKAE